MSATVVLALAFAIIIAVGSVAVAVNDALERWLDGGLRREPGCEPGGRTAAPVAVRYSVRAALVTVRRPAGTVGVRERRRTVGTLPGGVAKRASRRD